MNVFENKIINGIHASRYAASYENAGGKITGLPRYDRDFIEWLKTLFINDRKLTEEEIDYIYRYAQTRRNGKLELQENAKEFLKGA